MSDTPIIEIRENGPLILKGVKTFRMPGGSTSDEKPLHALCRCGQSKNKPYCDGSHKAAGFDGASTDVAHRDHVYSYEGAETTVHYNKLLCSHAGECGKRALAIFNPEQKPWVQPDAGTLDDIKQVVAACPSGALRYTENDVSTEITNDEITVTAEPNGPYHITNIPIAADYWADGQSQKKYVLCRCGLSQNKPFCDGTHHDKGWKGD